MTKGTAEVVIQKNEWVLEKKISIGTALLMLVQTIALAAIGAWYVSDLDSRVVRNGDLAKQNSQQINTMAVQQSISENNAARFDERLKAFDRQLARLGDLIDKMNDKTP